MLQRLGWALSNSIACTHWSCSGSASARPRETLLSSLQACSTCKVLAMFPRKSGTCTTPMPGLNLLQGFTSNWNETSDELWSGEDTKLLSTKSLQCYPGWKGSQAFQAKEACLSSTSRALRSQNCCFPICFMFALFVSSPGALGHSIKVCPTPSSSILSSCLPLLCEVGKSQFIVPLVSSVGRTVFVERAACILPPLSSVNGLGCETGHWLVSLPAVVLSKAQDIRPALSNQRPGTSSTTRSSAMLLLHYWRDEELPQER